MKKILMIMLTCLSFIFCFNVSGDTLHGDVTGEGIVSAEDALGVLKHVADLEKIDEAEIEKADVNKDSFIDSMDSLYILKYAAGIIDAFEDIVIEIPEATDAPVKGDTEYEVIDELNVDYDCFNCFEIEIISSEEKVFTAEDFDVEGVSQVFTKGKKKSDEYYLYTLVLVIEDGYNQNDVMNDFRVMDDVQSVEYNYYVQNSSILELNHNELQIEVGETVELYIEDYRYYYKDWNEMKLAVTFSKDITDDDNYTVESLSKYGVVAISKEFGVDTNYEYTINVDGKLQNDRDMVALAHLFSQMEAVDEVFVMVMHMPSETGNLPAENWKCSDLSSVSMELKGGTYETLVGKNKLDQTAVITGLTPGRAIITVNRSGFGSEATATCIVTVVESDKGIVDVDYENALAFRTGYPDENRPYLGLDPARIKIISTYSEYEDYINLLKEHNSSVLEKNGLDKYNEEYFNDNVLLLIDYTLGDYGTEVKFKDIEYVISENIYQINIEHYSSMVQLPALQDWDIVIPFEGKECSVEDFRVNIISVYDNMCWNRQCAPANGVEGYDTINHPIILDTYEEYQKYIKLFKEANPDYVLNPEYTEDDFEYLDVVVGGFWAYSGQLELNYANSIEREGKLTINFEGKCPSVCTDDTYFYHFMISYSGLDMAEEDISYKVDVEYY